jgi:non-ribosomal peptide synthetase component E (peptide arylation enzyme)
LNGTLYTTELIDEYLRRGFWDKTLTADNCDRNAREMPSKEAVCDDVLRLTWADVSRLTDKLAFQLHEIGFKRDDLLLAQMPNGVALFLLVVAGEKAGITIVTLQPTFRQTEMISIARHLQARGAVIPHSYRKFDYLEMLREIAVDLPELEYIIVAGDDAPEGTIALNALLEAEVDPTAAADAAARNRYLPWEITRIVTTSGTTGIPKCAEWPTSSLMCCGRNLAQRWELKPDDVVGAFYNIMGGGLSIFSIYSVPLAGAKLVLLEHFTPEGFCRVVEKERVTIAAIVPAEMARLLDFPDLDKYDLSSLRLLAHATTTLPYDLAVRAEERFGCRYVQTFGAMDVGPFASSALNAPRDIRLKTAGKPYNGNEVRILGDDGHDLPQGEIGEIVVRGPTCISGYYRNPELNAEKWIDGWCDTTNQGWLDPDGNMVIMARRRDGINRGGQNIYTQEIEEQLAQHPAVKQAAVVRMPDRVMGEKACAYVVLQPGRDFTFEAMLEFMRAQKIGAFKMPERLEIIAELPLIAAVQKIDVIALESQIAAKLEAEGHS